MANELEKLKLFFSPVFDSEENLCVEKKENSN